MKVFFSCVFFFFLVSLKCGSSLKCLLNFFQYCFCFMFWSFWPQGRWDLNHRITKKVPVVVSLLQRFTLFKKILVCSLVWKHQELSDVKKS